MMDYWPRLTTSDDFALYEVVVRAWSGTLGDEDYSYAADEGARNPR